MPRTSWSAWTIGEPFDQQVAGARTGVVEKRCFITCPECNEKINVSNAYAQKNLSLTARQHQKICPKINCDPIHLPRSKRPRSSDTTATTGEQNPKNDLAMQTDSFDDVYALQKQNSEICKENKTLVQENQGLNARVHSLEEKMFDLQQRIEQQDENNRERDKRDRQRDVWERKVSEALGFKTPPVPDVYLCTDKIDGLRKASILASATAAKEVERLKLCLQETETRLKIATRKAKDLTRLNDALQRNRTQSGGVADVQRMRTFKRMLLKIAHEDKCPPDASDGHRLLAKQLSQAVNDFE